MYFFQSQKKEKDLQSRQSAPFPRLRSRDNRVIESQAVLTWLRAVDMRKVLECGERNETTTEDLSAVSRTEPSVNPPAQMISENASSDA